jgi:hypothetical protein
VVRVLRPIDVMTNRRRLALLIGSWSYVACNEEAVTPDATVQSQLTVSWDARGCGHPHDVVLELEDDAGADLTVSAPCDAGSLVLDVQHFGVYRGHIYARTPPEQAKKGPEVRVDVDAPQIHRQVPTPR